jgi:hypothetical protein
MATGRSGAAQDGAPDWRHPSHDPSLDVAGPSWEKAIAVLAAKLRERYGDDRARVPRLWSSHDNTAG